MNMKLTHAIAIISCATLTAACDDDTTVGGPATGGAGGEGGAAGGSGGTGATGGGGGPGACADAGARGATCNPATADWPGCTLVDVPIRASVTQTIAVPAGNHATPFAADQANAEYVLDGDITADGTAITVSASNVVINLNGFTITYNETSPGEGVSVSAWNKEKIAVVNGSIIQGAAMSEGDEYGRGNNPVTTYEIATDEEHSVPDAQIANLYVKYGGRDVSGLRWSGGRTLIEQCTVEDIYEFGTLKNRHQGNDAIRGGGNAIVRNNTVVNSRHRGIQAASDTEVYGNHVTTRSIATNACGVFGYAQQNTTVYDNTIVARGEHALGICFVSSGTDNIEIYGNCIDSQTTAIGEEYGGDPACFEAATPCGNFAVGFRTTWGGNNINFHDNEIHIATDSAYAGTYAVDGSSVVVDGKGRGLMIGISAGEVATFANNTIEVLDKDGTGKAYGVACTANHSDGLFIIGNTITSNITNLALGDEYGGCEGFPLIACNELIKADDYPAYAAISNQFYGYSDTSGRVVGSSYSGGAAEDSVEFNPSGYGSVSVYFGALDGGAYAYSYRLHDEDNTSDTLLREDFDPPTTLTHAVPADLTACD